MRVIPVIDLIGGVVVRARMGDRAAYLPIETPLSSTSDPVDVVGGLLGVHPFSTLYVADLDAIARQGDNSHALRRIRAAFPHLTLWIDSGAADEDALAAIVDAGLGVPVIGSESQRDRALLAAHCGSEVVLSLDFRGVAGDDPARLLDAPHIWPREIIVMTLARVGSRAGPDFARLAAIGEVAGARHIYAAGGVRDGADLAALEVAGVAGALIATALHDGRISGADLDAIESRGADVDQSFLPSGPNCLR